MGEFQWGAGRGASPMVMVMLGTGVGGAAIVNGLLYRGLLGGHPEIGHLPVQPEGPACYCGTRGCWESLASGTAIAAAGEPFGFEDCRAVFAAAAENAHAAAIIRRAVEATASASWSLLHTFLPERIVLGGGLGEDQFDRFAPALLERIACATQVPPRGIEVLRAQLGKTAGVIGAACLALQNTQPSLT
jgi:glucokinase